uniref:alpha/beta fold hydrolase n=1 Tax=Caldimonas tepidiphila TaxID=2315841 RepID=UPI003012B637
MTALWVGHRARRAESDNPPIGRFVEVDGVRLHYVERGTGPTVVLLHGNLVLLQDFIASGLIDRLSRNYRVVAFDCPGFGHSERPRDRMWTASAQARLLHLAFAKLDIERPVVLGHSWGVLIALGIALDHPESLRGLVLASGYYYPTARLDVPLAAPPAIPVLGDVMRYTVSPVLTRLMLKPVAKAMFWPAALPDDFFGTGFVAQMAARAPGGAWLDSA